MTEFDTGIDTRDVSSGFIATITNEDGSSVDFWAFTESKARRKARDYLQETNE